MLCLYSYLTYQHRVDSMYKGGWVGKLTKSTLSIRGRGSDQSLSTCHQAHTLNVWAFF